MNKGCLITQLEVNKLIDAYKSNKQTLMELEDYIEDNGCDNDGITDPECSFEQGYNNALEYVFKVLGINVED